MEGSDGSPPQSLCMIRAAELFPKPQMEKEDEQLTVPFQELAGESAKYLGRTDDGVLALSNYRIFLLKNSTNSETSVPLGLIESAQIRDLFHLVINCKDASTVKCSFETAEQCSEWQRRIQLCVGVPESLESLFAFPFCSWTWDGISTVGVDNCELSERLQRAPRYEDDFALEVERLQFDLNGSWRISLSNEDFKLCPSYPQKILVPCCISDETLHNVANFRGSRRLPAVVWRHKKSGAVIARSSQPEVGWLGWRNSKDEQLLKALADACAFDRGEQNRRLNQCLSGESTPTSPDGSHEEVTLDEVRKILIVDARSYTSAVTNRARGGGCECIEYYPCAEIEFMNLGNIHVIRKSFHALRLLCASPPDVPNWLGLLEKTMWVQHLSGLLAASVTVCHAIERKGRPVLVHCSDGWDRTPQIVATAQLCLDPHYRTVEGFRILVEREWLSYGHKYADRCGHGPGSDEPNERCPVFLQWLDLVHQIHKQFPCSFEFSMGYLIKLAQHSLSCLFGTFLCNTLKERIENSVFERTFSVWPFLSGPMYRNPLYVANKEKVLWPAHNVRDLSLWTEVYLGSLGNQNAADFPPSNAEGAQGSTSPMAKTRSYGDLITAGIIQNGISRRSSDPNMTVDAKLIIDPNSENNSVIQSDREDSPDIMANLIHDTTEQLQNLTIELHHDENNFKTFTTEKPQLPSLQTLCSLDGNDRSDLKVQTQDEENDKKALHHLHMHQIYQQKQNTSMDKKSEINFTNGMTEISSSSAPLFSSPNECKMFSLSSSSSLSCAIESSSNGTYPSAVDVAEIQNGSHNLTFHFQSIYNSDEVDAGFTIRSNDLNLDLMQNVDLEDHTICTLQSETSDLTVGNLPDLSSEDLLNPWHGSVNTSTDTLMPIDILQQQQTSFSRCDEQKDEKLCGASTSPAPPLLNTKSNTNTNVDDMDGAGSSALTVSTSSVAFTNDEKKTVNNSVFSILPKVHSKPNLLAPSPISPSNNNNYNNSNSYNLNNNNNNTNISNNSNNNNFSNYTSNNSIVNNQMDESILILPEHEKLDISVSGKCESVPTNNATSTSSQRRRRTSSSNSRKDCINMKNINESTISRFSTPGVRSLPLTPPGLADRPQIAISCPDGLAHALSEQNIRLQQIVHEHKVREDVLLREIHDMRMALLKKICPNCNNAPVVNDEQSSVLDNVENLSICSWEAVEDRSGPSSSTSSIQPNTTSVLWVPDHAVSRCTSCQTEFWLGRRKHHCRSCGQIFCADCSEFWAPLPDEKLFSPVRLCGPCYHSVTTRMQLQQQQLHQTRSVHNLPTQSQNSIQVNSKSAANSAPSSTFSGVSTITSVATSTTAATALTSALANNILEVNINSSTVSPSSSSSPLVNNISNSVLNGRYALMNKHKSLTTATFAPVLTTPAMTTTAASSMEACKHAATNTPTNHRGPIKATAAASN